MTFQCPFHSRRYYPITTPKTTRTWHHPPSPTNKQTNKQTKKSTSSTDSETANYVHILHISIFYVEHIRTFFLCVNAHVTFDPYTSSDPYACSGLTPDPALLIIFEGQFQIFQRHSSSKLVLKTVESCLTILTYYENGVLHCFVCLLQLTFYSDFHNDCLFFFHKKTLKFEFRTQNAPVRSLISAFGINIVFFF
jgi:hypothetical protein